ncbi:hypothetical protein [Mucilaginibacter sp.]|uniref:hypothetical protein n=1 Tax=Mucilaginibacter sp. TaxID=1882438 RepID=UPI002606CAF3|nr:hypothetical protein [Mucilaginibacter sp.]MDB4926791.1 hypothetical protein [Mucilaginibacter sp.]
MNFLRFTLFILLLSGVIISCQKDQAVDLNLKSKSKTDSVNASGNILATRGTLQVSVNDSIYTFDATKDSIAFINLNIDSNKYFGITAINKAHTMSFGISSSGSAASDLTRPIAGGQLLFSADNKSGMQYTLTKNSETQNKIDLLQYMQDSVLTKGSFFILMAKDGKPNSPTYKVRGNFDLRIK